MFLPDLLSDTPKGRFQLDLRASADSCNDLQNCRTLFNIVWSCLTTLFACTWVAVHPNAPPRDRSSLWLLRRRLKLMLIAVLAPELIVGFAARQLITARHYAKDFDISETHSFFISMGGFVTDLGHPIVGEEDIQKYLPAIKEVRARAIEDKSKGDALSKGIALLQVLWFIAQCAARVHQRLPVTALEVATLAFATTNFCIWLLWWNKPLDVEDQIAVRFIPEYRPQIHRRGVSVALSERIAALFFGSYPDGTPKPDSHSVPLFWCRPARDIYAIRNPKRWTHAWFSSRQALISVLIETCVGLIFGIIHCLAWKTDFASDEEQLMWRLCAIGVAAIPLILAFYILIGTSTTGDQTMRETLDYFLIVLWILPYVVARLILLILPFTTLRALPSGAFSDVNWSTYVPHLN